MKRLKQLYLNNKIQDLLFRSTYNTLKDVRKRCTCFTEHTIKLSEKNRHSNIFSDSLKVSKEELTSFIDWLINKYGADYKISSLFPYSSVAELEELKEEREKGEERKKDTEEVSESWLENEDSETHGGDGNSGEVDSPAETESTEDRENNNNESQGGNESSSESSNSVTESDEGVDDGQESSACNRRQSNQNEDGETITNDVSENGNKSQNIENVGGKTQQTDDSDSEDPGDGKNQKEFMDNPYSSDSVSSTNQAEEASTQASESEKGENESSDSEDDKWEEILEGNNSEVSFNNRKSGSQDYANYEKAKRLSDIKSGRKFGREIEKIFKNLDMGGLEESPRVSGRKLISELKSKRCNLQRTKKEELSSGVFLLLPDVSGSCSAVCDNTLSACYSIQKKEPENYIVIPHVNGFLTPENSDTNNWESIIEEFKKIEKSKKIAGAVAFGDCDAYEEYMWIDKNCNGLLWLDSYCCNYTTAEESNDIEFENPKNKYFIGVNDIETALISIKKYSKNLNKN